jgi:hypothetical protein
MRKLILWLIGAAIALLGLVMAGSWLIGVLTRPTESYAEQQARIAREAANSELWRTMLTGAGLVLACLILLAGFGVYFHFEHKRKMERARFERDYNVLGYDQLGNGPVIFDRENMQLITVESGNAPYPPQYTFVNGAMPMQVKEPKRSNAEIPMVINTGGMKVAQPENYAVKVVQPEQLPAADPARRVQAERSDERLNGDFEAERPERSESVQDFGAFLRDAKRKGRGKQEAIEAITRTKKGGGKAYKVYSDFWDSIEV